MNKQNTPLLSHFSIVAELDEFGHIIGLNVTSPDDKIASERVAELSRALDTHSIYLAKKESLNGLDLGKIYRLQMGGSSSFYKLTRIENGEVYGVVAKKSDIDHSYTYSSREDHINWPQRLRLAAHQPNGAPTPDVNSPRLKIR